MIVKLLASVGTETSVSYIDSGEHDVLAVAEAFTQQFEQDWPGKLAGAVFTFSEVGRPSKATCHCQVGSVDKTHKVQARVTGLNFGARYKYLLPHMKLGDTVTLLHDEGNEAHENAIAVLLTDGSHLGYLTWDAADRFIGAFSGGKTRQATITAIDCSRPGSVTVEFDVPYNL